jgi:2-polyprenyl-3-methyl-5-hydroxy-6-metoxy-1,4-benzoquinol methylase
MSESRRDGWNERYAASPQVWSGSPNAVVVDLASGLEPGRALDVGCGEGADALWLAERGWRVLGVDVSDIAIDRATTEARSRAELVGSVEFIQGDLLEWSPPQHAFDLVIALFVHAAPAEREVIYRRLADSVAPSGTVLIVGHARSDATAGVRRPPAELLFEEADLAAFASGFGEVETSRRAREVPGPDPDTTVTVHDILLVARR